MPAPRPLALFAILLPTSIFLGGCASTSGYHNPKDPLEPLNRSVYQFNDALDKAVIKPVAKGYNAAVPAPGRTMVNNFFSNLDDVLVTLNDVLQFKLVQATSDFGRILINTTIGAFGLVDAATATGFEKHNEDFGQTLGYWGIGSGAYLMLPFFGPSSVRDGIGLYADTITSPTAKLKPIRRNQTTIADGVRKRSNLLENEKLMDEAELDRYSFIRDAYLSHRQSLVYDGNPPREKYEEDEDSAPAPAPAPKPALPEPATPAQPAPKQ
jgi:phospholipid-binding lipoprotein MlaA